MCAAAAYRSGIRLVDERTGETHDYSKRKGVLASEMHVPDGTPEHLRDRATLYNTIEQVEDQSTRRKTAQLAREVMLALPHELTHAQHKDYVGPYLEECFVSKGMIADISYHAPDQHSDKRNYHAHVLLTFRPFNAETGTFEQKDRSWNTKAALLEVRQLWTEHSNRALERAGFSETIDGRSFEDQGIDRVPTKHLGKDASAMERDGKETRIGDENRQAEHWNRELAEIEQDQKIIDLAIEREKRKIAKEREQKQKTALAQKVKAEPSRQEAQGFQSDHVLPTRLAERQNALHLKQLDERRALEGQIDRRRADMEATGKRDYDPQSTRDALTQAQKEAQKANTFLGRASGSHQDAQDRVEALRLNLEDIERRQGERTGFFDRNANEQLSALEQRHQSEREQLHSPASQDEETEDFREYTPDAPSSRAINDNEHRRDRDYDGPEFEP